MKGRFFLFWAWGVAVVLAKATAADPPVTSVQIINATSVPAISLSLNGREDYPQFAQGTFTGDTPTPNLTVNYKAVDKKTGAVAESPAIRYQPSARQSLVIMGDFSTKFPPTSLPQPGTLPSDKPYPPNVFFRVFPHNLGPAEKPVRWRILNAMPEKVLKISGKDVAARSLNPGQDMTLNGRPLIGECLAEIDGQKIPVAVRQRPPAGNAMIIFFLKDGKPEFRRIFENVAN